MAFVKNAAGKLKGAVKPEKVKEIKEKVAVVTKVKEVTPAKVAVTEPVIPVAREKADGEPV